MNSESAVFLASFPAIQSAIKVDGAGNGMRVQLDVPESEMGEALKLLMWRQVVLKVAIEPVEGNEQDRAVDRTKAKRRVVQGSPGM